MLYGLICYRHFFGGKLQVAALFHAVPTTARPPVMSVVGCSPSFFNLFEVGEKSEEACNWQAERQKLLLQSQGPKRGRAGIFASAKKAAGPPVRPPIHCPSLEPRNGSPRNLESY